MDISVLHDDTIYSFTQVGKRKVWVDPWQVMVPSFLSAILSQKAIDAGADPAMFEIQKAEENLATPKTKKARKPKIKILKNNMLGGFCPDEQGE